MTGVTELSRRYLRPHLHHLPADGPPIAAVLLMHGGQQVSHQAVRPWSLPLLRARHLAWSAHHELASRGVSVFLLRFALRGWNGDEASPVADARWALDEIARREPLPTVLVGHSMGARTALRVVGTDHVEGAVALAPWLPSGEPLGDLTGRRLVLAHGARDRTTDPWLSRSYADRARQFADDVDYRLIPGDGHALLRRPAAWNRIVAGSVLDLLGLGSSNSAAPS